MPESQFVTYAQNCEDVLLWRALKHVQNGFYVDVGAQDPVVDSVTKAFYDRGWRGINVEPVQHWYECLVRQRIRDVNLCVAVSDHDGDLKLCVSEDSGLSTSNEKFAQMANERGWELRETVVPCTTLSKICTEYVTGALHFLKIDCEGAESAALRGMRFSQVRPWIVLVEATEPNSAVPTYAEWEPVLIDAGYDFVYTDGINRYYVAAEHAELRAAFTSPPNALDDYIHASELRVHELQHVVVGLQSEFDGRGEEVARLQQEYRDLTDERETLRIQLADMQQERHVLATEISRLQLEYREITEARELMRTQLLELQGSHAGLLGSYVELQGAYAKLQSVYEVVRAELVALRASHSWRLTAPLRATRRRAGKVIRTARRGALCGLRPVARALRPTLRKLAQNRVARKWITSALGKDAAVIRHGRLFLFGAPPVPVASDVDLTKFQASETSGLSRRERIVLSELQHAMKAQSGNQRDA